MTYTYISSYSVGDGCEMTTEIIFIQFQLLTFFHFFFILIFSFPIFVIVIINEIKFCLLTDSFRVYVRV